MAGWSRSRTSTGRCRQHPNQNIACLEAARGSGARIVVNTAPWVPGAELLVAMADVLVVNAGEAAGLSGATAPEAAAEALAGRGPDSVVVTLGAAGVHVLTGDSHHRLRTIRARVRDDAKNSHIEPHPDMAEPVPIT